MKEGVEKKLHYLHYFTLQSARAHPFFFFLFWNVCLVCPLLKFLIATVYCPESLHSADIVWCTNCTDSPATGMSTWTNIMFSSFHSSHWLVLTVGKFLQKEAFTNFTPPFVIVLSSALQHIEFWVTLPWSGRQLNFESALNRASFCAYSHCLPFSHWVCLHGDRWVSCRASLQLQLNSAGWHQTCPDALPSLRSFLMRKITQLRNTCSVK